MEFSKLQARAMAIGKLFEELQRDKYGRSWSREEIAVGFAGDVGELMKLVLAKSKVKDIPDSHAKLSHELADCLWSVIVLAKLYEVDLEESFVSTMHELEELIKSQLD